MLDRSKINRQRIHEMRGKIKKGMIREFKLGCEEWKVETVVFRGASLTSRFDIDKIT